MTRVIWLAVWWGIVALVGWSLFSFMRLLTSARFRDRTGGDISTEVGYETDSYGMPKHYEQDGAVQSASADQSADMPTPHQAPGG
jgi:hypothetical protein